MMHSNWVEFGLHWASRTPLRNKAMFTMFHPVLAGKRFDNGGSTFHTAILKHVWATRDWTWAGDKRRERKKVPLPQKPITRAHRYCLCFTLTYAFRTTASFSSSTSLTVRLSLFSLVNCSPPEDNENENENWDADETFDLNEGSSICVIISHLYDTCILSDRRSLSIKRGTVLMASAFLAGCLQSDFFGLQWLIDAADPSIKQISSVPVLRGIGAELRDKVNLSSPIDFRMMAHAQRTDKIYRNIRMLSKRSHNDDEAESTVHFWDSRSFSETVFAAEVTPNNEESQFFAISFSQIYQNDFDCETTARFNVTLLCPPFPLPNLL